MDPLSLYNFAPCLNNTYILKIKEKNGITEKKCFNGLTNLRVD